MSTQKYGLDNVSIGTGGWDGILDDNMEDIDTHLHTRIIVTLGEVIVEAQAVAIGSGGKGYLAKRGVVSDKKPSIGLAIEGGIEDDEIRVQRVGPFTSTSLSFSKIGRPVYLGSTYGDLTQTRPTDDIQFMGVATAATTILLGGNVMMEDYQHPSTTTTTTSTTTTSTTTTSTTTTT